MKPLIVANWKMNPTSVEEAVRLAKKNVGKRYDLVICPPFIFLEKIGKKVCLGAQDCFWENEGSFTGEISPSMLKKLGVGYVIVGHSERRTLLNESDEMVNRKVKAVLAEGLSVILCIGENGRNIKKVLRRQLKTGLKDVKKGEIIIAYEPVWAIGTGRACTPKIAEKVRLFILQELKKLSLKDIKILYGGGVTPANITDYPSFSGFLIGGASFFIDEFR